MTPQPQSRSNEEADDAVEYETTIRGRKVSCWLENGELVGDSELVDRVHRAGNDRDVRNPVDLARLVNDAVGSGVTIRFRRSGGTLEIR